MVRVRDSAHRRRRPSWAIALALTVAILAVHVPVAALARSGDDRRESMPPSVAPAAQSDECCAGEDEDGAGGAPCCPDDCHHCALPCCALVALAPALPEPTPAEPASDGAPPAAMPVPPSTDGPRIFHPPRR